jgi:hypothetical protein
MTTLPLTAKNRLTKVLAAIRNHERFNSTRIRKIMMLYSYYLQEHALDELDENFQMIYKMVMKYRPHLIKHINSK